SPFPGAPVPASHTPPAPAPPAAPTGTAPPSSPLPGSPTGASTSATPPPVTTTSFSTASFVATARSLTGVRYRLGGDSPDTGFDCSGYVHYVFGMFRVRVPRTVAEQYQAGRKAGSTIKAGDLLFFRTQGASGAVSHVALALGPDEFIHAP